MEGTMKFIGCCVNGELYESNGIVFIKRYIDPPEHLDLVGELADSHIKTSKMFEPFA